MISNVSNSNFTHEFHHNKEMLITLTTEMFRKLTAKRLTALFNHFERVALNTKGSHESRRGVYVNLTHVC